MSMNSFFEVKDVRWKQTFSVTWGQEKTSPTPIGVECEEQEVKPGILQVPLVIILLLESLLVHSLLPVELGSPPRLK